MMAKQNKFLPPLASKSEEGRDYKCPCGKAYLSYPALFTHIKQKHNGKAPGDIKKPCRNSRVRRPFNQMDSNTPGHQKNENNLENRKKLQQFSGENSAKDNDILYWKQFNQIFNILKQVQKGQTINDNLWVGLESFKKFEYFMDERQWQSSIFSKQCLGNNLSEFLHTVLEHSTTQQFYQILLLFLSLLQYIMQCHQSITIPVTGSSSHSISSENILHQCPVDILIQYINPFISYYAEQFSVAHDVGHLWILRKQNISRVFMCFYHWLKWKQYTGFCITLIQ